MTEKKTELKLNTKVEKESEVEMTPTRCKKKSNEAQLQELFKEYYLRWVNDDNTNNIQDHIDKGFVFVLRNSQDGTRHKVKEHAGLSGDNSLMYRFLMKQPLNFRKDEEEEMKKDNRLPYDTIMSKAKESKGEFDIDNMSAEQIELFKKKLGLSQR